MTENELTLLQTNLQQFFDNQDYDAIFKQLAKHSFFKVAVGFSQLRNTFIGGHMDEFFHSRLATFVHKCLEEEREKLHVQLDEAILRKEQENARLDNEISEKKKMVEALNQQTAITQLKLISLPVSPVIAPDKDAIAYAWFETAKSLPNRSDKILAYDKAIACKPDFVKAYFERGMAKQELRKYQEAVTDFTKVIEHQIDFSDAYFERGFIKSVRLSQNIESLADFTQAILLNPEHEFAYLFRGLAKQELKMYREAVIDYKQYLTIDNEDHSVWKDIAECYSMLQDKQNALQYLTKAIQVNSIYKEISKEHKAFEWLWEDADFKRLVDSL